MGQEIAFVLIIVINIMIFTKIILASIRSQKRHQEVLSILEKLQKKQKSTETKWG